MITINKTAFFTDNKFRLNKANIMINGGYIEIDTFDQSKNPTGYANVHFHQNKRFYLDTIYCYDKYRSSGIGTYISELIEYLLRYNPGYVIRGSYNPMQLSTDLIDRIQRSKEELDLRARAFYKKNGYNIVEYSEFIENQEKYPYLVKEDFFIGDESDKTIVAKQLVPKKHSFYERDGILYYDNKRK